MSLTLRPYQQNALDSLFLHIESKGNKSKPLVVAATGAGKSVLIAKFCEKALEQWPETRIVMLTHVKELVEQNYKKMRLLLPPHKIGVYCAGLNRKQPNHPIVCGSVQSVHRAEGRLGTRHIIIIDEVHLMKSGDEGMYRSFINQYPDAIVIGFTATPFRTDSGKIAGKGKFFTDIVADISILDLLKQGYLAPLVAIDSDLAYDTSSVRITAGDFNKKDLEAMALDIEKTRSVVAEMMARGADRNKWLIFCASIRHAEAISLILNKNGISCAAISEKTPQNQRRATLKSYTEGDLRAIANVGVLTTGFDSPDTDMIVLLRPTQSAVLYVQMLGRGMRISERKTDCLVLDYGENVMRHGPVTHVKPPSKKGRTEVKREFVENEEDGPKALVCQECRAINELTATACYMCGQDIIKEYRKVNHQARAARGKFISWDDASEYKTIKIDRVRAFLHQKKGSPDSIRVHFESGLDTVPAWLCIFHQGFAAAKGKRMWSQITNGKELPANVASGVMQLNNGNYNLEITIKQSGKYPEILEIKHAPQNTDGDTGNSYQINDTNPERQSISLM